jgi:ABC-2 type transport system permease protein
MFGSLVTVHCRKEITMSPDRIFALARRIVQQFRRDHRTLGLLIGAPIVILALLGYLMRSQETSTLRVGILSLDQPAGPVQVSALLIDQLKQNDRLVVQDLSGDGEAARAAVRQGTLDAALIFPATFSADVLARRPISLEVVLEGANPGKTSSALPILQGALLQAGTRLAASIPGATAPPQLGVRADLIYGTTDLKMLDYFAPVFIAFFAFFLIFLLTCVSFLRERTQGTMERLAASPMRRGEIVLGYMLGFGLFALIQSTLIVLFTAYVLQVRYTGNLLWVLLLTLILALGAVNLGIFLSTYARNELQAIQFIPIVITPQVLLSGLLWPVRDMPEWLQWLSAVMPLTYANTALTDIMIRNKGLLDVLPQLGVLLGFAVLMVLIASVTLRREVA